MNVYRLWSDNRFQDLSLATKSDKSIVKEVLSTQPLKTDWPQVGVKLVACEDERMIARPIGDCPSLAWAGVALSRQACEAVAGVGQKDVEFLPLRLIPPHD